MHPGWTGLERAYLLGLWSLGALACGELDPLVLLEGTEPVHQNRRVVHEDIGAAVVRRDKAVALARVEPFHCALRHLILLDNDLRIALTSSPAAMFRGRDDSKLKEPFARSLKPLGDHDVHQVRDPHDLAPAGLRAPLQNRPDLVEHRPLRARRQRRDMADTSQPVDDIGVRAEVNVREGCPRPARPSAVSTASQVRLGPAQRAVRSAWTPT